VAPGPGVAGLVAVGASHAGPGRAAWLDHLLRQSGRGVDLTIFDVATLWSRSRTPAWPRSARWWLAAAPTNPVGWLILACGLLGQGSFVISSYSDYGLLGLPGAVPAARLVASFFTASGVTRSPAWSSSCCSRRPGHCPRPAGDR